MRHLQVRILAAVFTTMLLGNSALADCTRAYVNNIQSNVRKAEKALAQAERKVERLEVQRIASRDSIEQKINNVEYRRTAAYTSLTTLTAAMNGVGAIINCILNPSECENEVRRIQNLINTVNRTIVRYEQQLRNLRDSRDRTDALYVTRIQNAQTAVAGRITQLTGLSTSLDGCKELQVTSPANNATVQSPVQIRSRVIAGTLAPLGDGRPGRVVLGIVIDGAPLAIGAQFPLNQSGFIVLDQGQAQTSVPLSVGSHTFTVQVLDTLGVVRGDFNSITRTITVN